MCQQLVHVPTPIAALPVLQVRESDLVIMLVRPDSVCGSVRQQARPLAAGRQNRRLA